MRISCYETHPACDLFPLMSDPELSALADDIRRNGLQAPIIIHEGRILDGRNRLLACLRVGAAPKFDHWRGSGSPVRWLVSMNLHRRHLDTSQRAMIAARALAMFEVEARARQGQRTDLRAELRESDTGKASEKAAALMDVSPRTVEHAKAVLRYGGAELVRDVELGRRTVSAAAALARRPMIATQPQNFEHGDGAERAPAKDGATVEKDETAGRQRVGRFDVVALFPSWGEDSDRYHAVDIDSVAACDAVLFLGAPDCALSRALRLLSRWRFRYASTLVVTKPTAANGAFFAEEHEFVLVGSRGKCAPVPPRDRRPESILDVRERDPIARHGAVLDRIDRMFPGARKVELFARRSHPNWSALPCGPVHSA